MLCDKGKCEFLTAANARIAELTAERQRDALDGQVALDEANSRITSYEQQFGDYCKWAKSDVGYWKKRAGKAEAKAKQLIKKLTYNTPSFRDGECDEDLLTIDENELVPLKSCMCDRLKQAEAQCNQMEADCADFQAIIKRLQEENAKRFNDNTAMYERMMGAEAQNNRMQTAINRYVIGNIDLLDALKAALEGRA